MIENRDIVITGLQPWNFSLGSNIANIARAFSKNNRILFVNYAFDRQTLWRKRKETRIKSFYESRKSGQLLLENPSPDLWVLTPRAILESINKISSKPVFDLLNRMNGRRFSHEILQAIDQLKFKDFYLFTDNDFYRSLYLREILKPSLFIYYLRDNMIAVDYWIHGKRLEKAIMNKADIVVANSEYLAAYARTVNPNSSFVGQGCDLELYHPKNISPLPEEVTRLKNEFKLVIGYIGALNSARIDIELLEFLAFKKPEWAIVLVGPEDPRFQKSSLHKQKNVIFLGLKKEKELPGYIGFFDIAINPQKVNEITVGNYPRKIDEYLAMGKPIVATRTEAMDFFTGQVYLAQNYEDYITLIELAATENDDLRSESRMRYARQHSWENNIEEIGRKIQDLKNDRHDGSTN